jgi:hypothetical protein
LAEYPTFVASFASIVVAFGVALLCAPKFELLFFCFRILCPEAGF